LYSLPNIAAGPGGRPFTASAPDHRGPAPSLRPCLRGAAENRPRRLLAGGRARRLLAGGEMRGDAFPRDSARRQAAHRPKLSSL